jgi:fused signal recognition particle receptor
MSESPSATQPPSDESTEEQSPKKKKKGWLSRRFGGGDEAQPAVPEAEDLPPEDPTEIPVEAQSEDEAEGTSEDAPVEELETGAPLAVEVLTEEPSVIEALDDSAEAEAEPALSEAPELEPEPPQDDQTEAPTTGASEVTPTVEKKSWFQRLKDGLSRSSSKLTSGISDLFTKRKLDDEALEELEDLLIQADLGVKTASTLTQALAKGRFGKDITGDEVRAALAEEASRLLEPVAQPLTIDRSRKPHVILVVGVNGAGKTTTIGKMAKQFTEQGLSISLAAGDTFRAAAVEQLKVWGERTGCPVIARDTGADAAGLAYDALKEATERGDDILMIDTAGRLHNKAALMDELGKIRRVIQKLNPSAPHTTLLVLDATVGQNAHQQVKVFGEMVDVTGLVMTKLDGTAKGGVVVALAQEFGLPVHYVGVGETADDLRAFDATDFARGLMGLS